MGLKGVGLVRDVVGSVAGRAVGRVDVCKSDRGEVPHS